MMHNACMNTMNRLPRAMPQPAIKPTTTILLVDDHVMVRAGTRSLIDRLGDFSVIAEASDPEQAMREVARQTPDIVVTDITMGERNGLDLVRLLKQQFPQVATISLSMHLKT